MQAKWKKTKTTEGTTREIYLNSVDKGKYASTHGKQQRMYPKLQIHKLALD